MPLHPMATMADPSLDDIRRSLIHTLWLLREELNAWPREPVWPNVDGLTAGAVALSNCLDYFDNTEPVAPTVEPLLATVRTARELCIAKGHNDDRAAEWYKSALKHAKAQVHKKLAALVERWPHCIEHEEERRYA